MSGLSLVTYSHNDHAFAGELLAYADRFGVPLLEKLLVDDASAPPYVPAPEGRELRLIRLDDNVGAAQAKFKGINASMGEIVFSLDCDIRPHIHWLKGALGLLRDPAVGLVGAACTPARKAGFLAAALYRTSLVPREVRECVFTPGGCMLMRREAWEAIGGLRDYPAGARAFEDAHISRRMRELGFKVLQDNRLPVYETRNLHRLAWCRREARYEYPLVGNILQKYGGGKYFADLAPILGKALDYFQESGDPILVYVFLLKQVKIFASLRNEGRLAPGAAEVLPGILEILAARPAALALFMTDLSALNGTEREARSGATDPSWRGILARVLDSGAVAALDGEWADRYLEEERRYSFDRHYTDGQ
ncbi:MAG: glycosyltransferase family 2 protein [Desulfovibrionaceae bacterium]|nr:glycosyltransferase family 2 protein [Desulfovibrionaceae bacterium]